MIPELGIRPSELGFEQRFHPVGIALGGIELVALQRSVGEIRVPGELNIVGGRKPFQKENGGSAREPAAAVPKQVFEIAQWLAPQKEGVRTITRHLMQRTGDQR